MFTELDDVDWAALDHAYGPADGVPDMLRGLVSPDPATREIALDQMEGAVHHQGSVYDSTLAAIPFLIEAATRPGLPGRGEILELLASIGGSHATGEPYVLAAQAVATGYPAFLRLLGDDDAQVRKAVGKVLRLFRPDAATVVGALWERLAVEPDPDVRIALAETAGAIAAQAKDSDVPGVDPAAVAAKLQTLAATDDAVRLTALIEFVRCSPDPLPPELVADVVRQVAEMYAQDRPAPDPVELTTPTLRSHLREAFQRDNATRPSPEMASVLRETVWAFGDRVEERTRLLVSFLRAPDWACRYDALLAARDLVSGWRGDYRELAVALGEQLLAPQRRLTERAAETLFCLGSLAAPAADALVSALEAAPREESEPGDGPPPWIIRSYGAHRTCHALHVLTRLRDPRALPMLRSVREHDPVPGDNGHLIGYFEPSTKDASDPVELWRATGDPQPALRAAADGLAGDIYQAQAASNIVYELGPIAAALATEVRALLQQHDEYGWLHFAATRALWSTGADTETTFQVLSGIWVKNPILRLPIAKFLAEMGAAAAAAAPLLRAELAAPLRHTVRKTGEYLDVYDSDVTDDEELLKTCAAILAAL